MGVADRWNGRLKLSQKPGVRHSRGTPLILTLSPQAIGVNFVDDIT